MADERAALLERAQLLQKAKSIQMTKFPGADAVGVTDGPTPAAEDKFDAVGTGMGAVGAAAKVLDIPRGLLTGPALGTLIEKATGKKVFEGKDWANSVNPTNLSTFPSTAEMAERAGVPEGAKLSDIMGGYADPEQDNPWYQPEKGGMLDFTLRGAGGLATDIAIDPLTYLSLGGSAAAKKGLQVGAKEGAEAAGKGILSKIGEGTKQVLKAPSEGVSKIGKKMYNSVLQAVEHEGEKFGKSDVGETLYNAKIKTPYGLRDKAAKATDQLMSKRNAILDEAGEAGAKVDMSNAMEGARAEIQKLRDIKDTDAAKLADELEAKINEYVTTEKGIPGTPETTRQTPTGILDESGSPILKSETVPGKAEIPGSPYTPNEASALKSFMYSNLPTSTFQQNLNTPVSARIKSAMTKGVKEGTELAVGKSLSPEKAAELAHLNSEAGKLIATRKAQTRVGNMAERTANNIGSITGTDGVTGALGSVVHGNIEGGLQAMLLKKAIDAMRLGTMPVGYGLRKAGEGKLTQPAIDIYLRNKLKQSGGRGSERERRERGQEE